MSITKNYRIRGRGLCAHRYATHALKRQLEPTNKDLKKLTSLLAVTLLVATIASVARAQDPSFQSIQSSGAIEYPSDGIPRVTVSGTNFIVNGQPFIFRGVNIEFPVLAAHYYGSPFPSLSDATFNLLKSWNVNIIRVWLNIEMASPSYGTWTSAFFTAVDTLIDLAEAHNIYILLSVSHSYNLALKYGGAGLPNWMFDSASSDQYASDGGWATLYKAVVTEDPALVQVTSAIREYYHRIATYSKDRNIVMGYDLFNEPEFRRTTGYDNSSATRFYEKLATWILEIDAAKPICVENNFMSTTKPDIPNLFSSPHTYITQNAGDSVTTIKNRLVGYNGIGSYNTWGVPVLSGEWWGPLIGDGNPSFSESTAVQQTINFCIALDQLGWSSTICRHEAQIPNLHPTDSVEDVYFDYFSENQQV